MDLLIVLHDAKAVKTFCSRMHFSLGAGCSVAAGPIGRVVEADMRAGDKGSGMCYTYSCSKGNTCTFLSFQHSQKSRVNLYNNAKTLSRLGKKEAMATDNPN